MVYSNVSITSPCSLKIYYISRVFMNTKDSFDLSLDSLDLTISKFEFFNGCENLIRDVRYVYMPLKLEYELTIVRVLPITVKVMHLKIKSF
jgi:hypothetical protein